uniref:Uncharacterized protein n=1 Tax=Corethron hystrix TaxID=216773 RepID=A0A6U5GBB2_9STRA|mmetsp:Transcript_26035/g.59893  ORF Transcript_26035/g.59893 Transcript_26035/m.59893 type:complete len:231 (+) Transcript_26035:254-946(+)|eukprot:CAMPEP_0113325660 /NCGR_PEP_ID=MMETSP0010_2-20120614/17924_1 /TAXON_ID=216773 ORGANISM="Corethron hystrix, Strain 308" /NCGR_SAMPLE_ID=MMETSP0010_2 /ASSEMBLY_ACC=CAM_ASM_000155 /LENGTH=230 /DNA_ID=CAMNT_0000185575 /DNA_START=180 /DNA_END=872 /DNA_ORIENTATION=- /assembly_acc=CAM_ASM_000155
MCRKNDLPTEPKSPSRSRSAKEVRKVNRDKSTDPAPTQLWIECENRNWDRALLVLKGKPSDAQIAGDYGRLPLHEVCIGAAPLKIVRAILVDAPRTISTPDDFGQLPLHYAAKWGAPLDVLALLIRIYPQAQRVRDHKGRTPLHFACFCKSTTFDVIHLLLQMDGGVATIVDDEGRTPLHYAAKFEAPFDIQWALFMHHPRAVRIEDQKGCTPVQYGLDNSTFAKCLGTL